jgi:hypothetical protein
VNGQTRNAAGTDSEDEGDEEDEDEGAEVGEMVRLELSAPVPVIC